MAGEIADGDRGQVTTSMPVGYQRYAMITLMLIYTLNFVDRQIINILIEPIKAEFHLSDSQLGLLTGLPFALFYVTLGIPIARYAERADRPRIIALAVGVWSLFTALCGMAATFTQLLLARIGVAVGEAGCSPPAHSLIADTVPKERRASALAFYQLGSPLGALLGMVIGGVVASIAGWRGAFLVVGLPGLVFALLALLVLREPRRKAAVAAGPENQSIAQAFRYLKTKPSLWWACLASGIKAIFGYGQGVFIASFFLRNYSAEMAELGERLSLKPIGVAGLVIGLALGIGGLIGTWGGGLVTDWLVRRNPKGYALTPTISSILIVPIYLGMVLTGSFELALFLFFIQAILSAVWPGPVYAICQGVVPPNLRATASSVQLLFGNLIGLALGPLAIGIISDVLSGPFGMGPGEGIRWALMAVSLLGLVGAAMFHKAGQTIERDMVS